MNKLDTDFDLFNSKHQYISLQNEKDKLIVYEKGDLLFVFNFHPTKGFEHYRIGTKWNSPHKIIMDSDENIYVTRSGYTGEENFIDPMCGSGTILIEAAMIANNIPANINRKEFGFEKWKDYDEDLFFTIQD